MLEPTFYVGVNFLDNVFNQIYEEEKRAHEQKMKELEIIADSSLRDQLAAQLVMDQFLAPIENAQNSIQNTAKHAQYLAEAIGYHYADHGMNLEQAREVSSQFRLLAIKLTESNTLYDLKIIYRAITIFTDNISRFKHQNRHYAIERSIRENILNPLNTCIASYENFQTRSELLGFDVTQKLDSLPSA